MKLYLRFLSMHLKSCMAYKESFFMSLIGTFLQTSSALLAIWFLFARFESVNGYTFAECVLCAGVIKTSFALSECFFRGFDKFDTLVRSGSFDRILIRPRNSVFMVLCERIEIARLGKALQGVLMLAYGVAASGVDFTPIKFLTLTLMLAGGVTVFSALFILFAGACFFTLEGLEVLNILIYGPNEYFTYPLDLFGGTILRLCTFIVPYALFQYYPLLFLLGRVRNPIFAFTPCLTILFLLPCLALWRFGVRKYQSSGS